MMIQVNLPTSIAQISANTYIAAILIALHEIVSNFLCTQRVSQAREKTMELSFSLINKHMVKSFNVLLLLAR